MKLLLALLLVPFTCFADIRIKVVVVPGVRQLSLANAKKAVRLGIKLYLSKAYDGAIDYRISRLSYDPCPGMSDIASRSARFFCLRDWDNANDIGVGYDVLYIMLPPMPDDKGIYWVAGQSWVCSNFATGNAKINVFKGSTFRDRWRTAVIPFSHECGHALGASHTLERSIMSPDAGQDYDKWPMDVLPETVQQIRECQS